MACRTARAKRELLRVVRTPEREIVIDPTGRLAGRGAYVCDQACFETAVRKGALGRALGAPLPEAFRAGVGAGTTIPTHQPTIDTTNTLNTPNTSQGGARGQE